MTQLSPRQRRKLNMPTATFLFIRQTCLPHPSRQHPITLAVQTKALGDPADFSLQGPQAPASVVTRPQAPGHSRHRRTHLLQAPSSPAGPLPAIWLSSQQRAKSSFQTQAKLCDFSACTQLHKEPQIPFVPPRPGVICPLPSLLSVTGLASWAAPLGSTPALQGSPPGKLFLW